MKHADAFKIRGPLPGEKVSPFVIACTFCDTGVITLRHDRPWREVAVVVKNHVCPQLRAALDKPPVLVGQATLSNELGLCNSAYRPIWNGKTVVLRSGHHAAWSDPHDGGGYIWDDRQAENYS